jgi:hypothetical protein
MRRTRSSCCHAPNAHRLELIDDRQDVRVTTGRSRTQSLTGTLASLAQARVAQPCSTRLGGRQSSLGAGRHLLPVFKKDNETKI